VVWRVAREDARAVLIEQLAGAVSLGRKTALVGPEGRGKTDVLLGVGRLLGDEALLLRVPWGLDQAEAVVLQAAHGLGADALREVDATLRGDVAIDPALAVLDRHLNGRALLVDDIDALASRPVDFDLHGVVKARASAVEAWLGERAALCSSAARMGRIDFRTRDLEPLAAPPLRVTNGAPRDVGPLWDGVGRDPTRFRLALTLAQLEGGLPDKAGGRDEPLVEAVWAALPAAYRSVLALLAVHGRPVPEEVLRAVPSPPSDRTIEAVRSLRLPSAWRRSRSSGRRLFPERHDDAVSQAQRLLNPSDEPWRHSPARAAAARESLGGRCPALG